MEDAHEGVDTGSGSRIIFVTAWSGCGKTTTGDYLGTCRGFLHVDGDEDMRKSGVPELVAATQALIRAFSDYWFKDKSAPTGLWHPYYQLLVDKCLDARQAGDRRDIVVSMSVYRREVRDFLRSKLGDELLFLKLECDVDVVVRGALGRLEEYLKTQGGSVSVEDHWNGPSQFEGVCFREKYGEFSFDNWKRMQLDYFLSGMEPFAEDEKDHVTVDVSARNKTVFSSISSALGLPPLEDEIDLEELKNIQKKRWADGAIVAGSTEKTQ